MNKNKSNKNRIIKIVLPIIGALLAIIAFSIYNFFFKEEYEIPEGSAEFHYIDVGQGDATLILADEMNVLIDTGEDDKTNTLINYLKDKKIETIDYFIITHFDSDHFGEAEEILDEFKIVNLIIPDQTKTSNMFNSFIGAINEKPEIFVSVIGDDDDIGGLLETDDVIDIDDENDRKIYVGKTDDSNKNDKGDLELEFLGPAKDSYKGSNDYSIFVMARWGKNKMLFTGDAERDGEKAVIEKYKNEASKLFDCDVFHAGHHGSDTSSCKDLLDYLTPKYFIISCGADNKYGHPHEETVERFKNIVSENDIYRTDLQGDIVLTTDGEEITIKTEK